MNDCSNTFAADSSNNFLPSTCCSKHIKHDTGEPGLFKEEFRCIEMIRLCSRTYCCSIRAETKSTSVAKDSTKERSRNPALDPWKSTAAYWTRKQLCSQLIEASELSNIQSARTNKLKEVYHTFILKELYSTMAFTRNHLFCK